jgi:hypothetical protein
LQESDYRGQVSQSGKCPADRDEVVIESPDGKVGVGY